METEIREAVSGEEGKLLAAYEWLFAPPGAVPPGWERGPAGERLADAIAGEDAVVLVAERDDAIAGICTGYLDLHSVRFGLRCWVEDLAVDPAQRSQGIGGALLDAAAEWSRERGATHLELDTALARTDAQRFYEGRRPAATSYCYSWPL